jgi:hypothetical protein
VVRDQRLVEPSRARKLAHRRGRRKDKVEDSPTITLAKDKVKFGGFHARQEAAARINRF